MKSTEPSVKSVEYAIVDKHLKKFPDMLQSDFYVN